MQADPFRAMAKTLKGKTLGFEVPPMETVKQRRLRKLRALCDKHGRETVSSVSGVSDDYLRQILCQFVMPSMRKDRKRQPRNVGDKIARQIEEKMGLGVGWFDND